MLSIGRRAPAALRILHFAPSSISNRLTASCSSRVSATAPAAAALQSWQRHALAQTARPFSSIPSRLQQAEALREETDQQELTHFEQLAQQNIISPRVISTITKKMDIHTMTDVQRMTLNHCLDGSDVIAQAKTGTGKTLAFLMPIVQRILRDPELESRRASRASTRDIRAVIISPTRELAEQIAVEAKRIVSGTSVVVQTAVGGTQKSMHLREMQRNGCHILVGTPGRILDLVSDPSTGISLENIETFVMDEADRLLDIGFAPTIADIQTYMPSRSENARQTLMFSATVPKSVVNLVRETLRPDFKFIRTIDPDESPTHDRIPQHVVFGRGLQNQIPIILEVAHNAIEAHKKDPQNNIPFKAIVYFGSKAEVQLAYETFRRMRDPEQTKSMFAPHPLDPCRIYGIHGGLNQAQRTREAAGFRVAESAILFSSDVTARGMDFPNVSHVIQIGLPKQADDYVHRIGRTGRAGKSGEGWLILNADERRDLNYKMKDSGINLKEASLVTSDLDMTRGAQIPAHIARLLKLVETGIKSVPYDTKTATYAALLGVLAQQNPSRSKQAQIDLMNDLAKFGWGMAEPPALSQRLVSKIGFGNVNGIRFENFRDTLDRAPRGEARGGMRGGDRGRNSFDRSDPFGQGASGGTGVFSNTSEGAGGDAFDTRGTSGGRSDAFGDRGDRGNRGERGFGRGGGGGGRNNAFGGDRGSSRAYGGGGGGGGGGFGRGGGGGGRERGRY